MTFDSKKSAANAGRGKSSELIDSVSLAQDSQIAAEFHDYLASLARTFSDPVRERIHLREKEFEQSALRSAAFVAAEADKATASLHSVANTIRDVHETCAHDLSTAAKQSVSSLQAVGAASAAAIERLVAESRTAAAATRTEIAEITAKTERTLEGTGRSMLDAHAKSTGQLARSLAALEASVAQIVSAATTQVEVVQRDLKDLQIQQAEATRGRIDTIEARLVQTLAEHATATSREIEVTAAIQNAATLRALWWLRLCSFFGCSLLLLELYRIAINILGYPT